MADSLEYRQADGRTDETRQKRQKVHFWSTLGYLFLVAVYGLLVIFSFNTGTKPGPVSGPVSEEVDEFAAATAMPMPNPKVAKQNPKELV